MGISGPLYVVIDTEAQTIVRGGIMSSQLFSTRNEASEVADKHDTYKVYKLATAP